MKAETITSSSSDLIDRTSQKPLYFEILADFVIATKVFYLASAWLLPYISEFTLTQDYISELALGRYGYIQTSAFVISGLGTIGLAYAILKLTSDSWGNLIGSILVGIYGAGAIIVAIFPTDRIDSSADVWAQSTSGTIHAATAFISFLCIITAIAIFIWMFRRDTRWRPLIFWSALLLGSALSLSFFQSDGPFVGLMQRLLGTAVFVWLIMVAFRVRLLAAAHRG